MANPETMPTELALSVELERDQVTCAASEQHAVVSLVAPPQAAERAPVSLVAVLDRSGSMSGEKLRLVLATMQCMLTHLKASDKLGVVSYGSSVTADCPLTACDPAGKERLSAALEQIRAGTSTALCGGLLGGLGLHSGGASFGNVFDSPAFEPDWRPGRARQVRMTRGTAGRAGRAQAANGYPAQRRSFLGAALDGVRAVLGSAVSNGTPPPPGQMQVPPPQQEEEEPVSPPEWTVELRCPPGAVRAVAYVLPGGERYETSEAPFRVTRQYDAALPLTVSAVATLADGQELRLSHELVLARGPHFTPVALPGEEPDQGVVRSTLLFTDGHANVGIQDTEGICAAARACLEATEAKSTIHTFGFGRDHNAEMLRAIAGVGDGEYFFIESQDNVADSFGEAIGGLLSTTHQNIELTVTAAPGVEVEALTSFEQAVEGQATTITLGDMFAEERRDVLLKCKVPAGAAALPLCAVRARAYSLQQQRFVDLGPLELLVARCVQQPEPAGRLGVLRHVDRHRATTALDAARARAAQDDLAGARALLAGVEQQLQQSPASLDALNVGLQADLRNARGSLARESEYRSVGSKKLALMSKMHGKQRACAFEGSTLNDVYAGSAQRAMKCTFKSTVR